jgi:6-phosphogluconate dehydrogenase
VAHNFELGTLGLYCCGKNFDYNTSNKGGTLSVHRRVLKKKKKKERCDSTLY